MILDSLLSLYSFRCLYHLYFRHGWYVVLAIYGGFWKIYYLLVQHFDIEDSFKLWNLFSSDTKGAPPLVSLSLDHKLTHM